MKVDLCKGIPQPVAEKAMHLIIMAEAGEIRPKRIWCSRAKTQVLEICYRYRAMKISGTWRVMTHESYNKKFSK